jgi:hypothetical protein
LRCERLGAPEAVRASHPLTRIDPTCHRDHRNAIPSARGGHVAAAKAGLMSSPLSASHANGIAIAARRMALTDGEPHRPAPDGELDDVEADLENEDRDDRGETMRPTAPG